MLESIRNQYESAERKGNVQHLTDLSAEKRTNKMPPQHVLDRMADQKLSGGFKTYKSNICTECNEAKSVNGSCGC
jgi:hypothetical protein